MAMQWYAMYRKKALLMFWPVGPGFLFLQGSDLKHSVPFAVFFSRGHECGWDMAPWVAVFWGSGSVNYRGILPFDRVVVLLNVFCYGWRPQSPSLAGILVLHQPGLEGGCLDEYRIKYLIYSNVSQLLNVFFIIRIVDYNLVYTYLSL